MPDVPVRCRQAAVTQLSLNDVQGMPLVGELEGVRVAKTMRMDSTLRRVLGPRRHSVARLSSSRRFFIQRILGHPC